jgi:hypothetical protein
MAQEIQSRSPSLNFWPSTSTSSRGGRTPATTPTRCCWRRRERAKHGIGPVYRETIERLVDAGVDVVCGITVASNKGLLRWDRTHGLVAEIARPRID